MKTEESKNETEILNAEDEKLRAMCRSLKRVEAPKDFDFKLKARLANTRADEFQPRFGFAFRYALPGLALLLVFGLFAFNSGFWASENNSVIAEGAVAQPNSLLPQNAATPSDSPSERAETAIVSSDALTPEITKSPERTNPQQAAGNIQPNPKNDLLSHKKDSGSGSKVFSSTVDKGRQPNINNSVITSQTPNSAEKLNPLSVNNVLSIMGINAELENGKWTVKSVAKNSFAENFDIRANDIIEAIDEQSLSAETSFSKTVSGETITVVRGGEKVVIKLKNK